MRLRTLHFGLMLSAAFANGQSCPTGLTPVVDTIYAPATGATAKLFGGEVTIEPSVPTSSSGRTFGRIPLTISVLHGAFSACLAPNDTAAPLGSSYRVTYAHHDASGTATWRETWAVTAS